MLNGFWLPKVVQDRVLTPGTDFESLTFVEGRPTSPGDPTGITAHWPIFSHDQWQQLTTILINNRQRVPRGEDYWQRFSAALKTLGKRLADPANEVRLQMETSLSGYTGFSKAMIQSTLASIDQFAVQHLPAAFSFQPIYQGNDDWQKIDGLPGRLRYYAKRPWDRIIHKFFGLRTNQVFKSLALPNFVVGYGAGNVPGTALLISILAQATTLEGNAPPVIVIKNSHREPIFAPLVFDELAAIDADLLATIAIMIWDYDDIPTQDSLLSQADLVIAAAGDETISQISTHLHANEKKWQHPIRFHPHGHKVSFSVIGRELLKTDTKEPRTGQTILDITAMLAALDSVFWDQFGCLSSRVHFVERGGEIDFSPLDYANSLVRQMRQLAHFLPRGAWPRRILHDRFDKFKMLEITGQVQVLSNYDDDFQVALDWRLLDSTAFRNLVNDCQGRVIIVRPIQDIMEVSEHYLKMIPTQNLQSLSVAIGLPGEGLSSHFLRFAVDCGACGVTAIRTVGRGAFPQLAYSWDGFIPLDLVRIRPPGHFTTIEFDQPYEQMLETYQHLLKQSPLTE